MGSSEEGQSRLFREKNRLGFQPWRRLTRRGKKAVHAPDCDGTPVLNVASSSGLLGLSTLVASNQSADPTKCQAILQSAGPDGADVLLKTSLLAASAMTSLAEYEAGRDDAPVRPFSHAEGPPPSAPGAAQSADTGTPRLLSGAGSGCSTPALREPISVTTDSTV